MRLALFVSVFACAAVAFADTPAELVQVARGYSGRGQDAKAIPLLQQALKGDPKNAEAHYLLGLAYSRQEKPKDAEVELTQAVALDPHNYQAFLLLGMTHDLRDDPAGALSVYEKGIAADPKRPEAWREAGSSALLLGKTDVAVKDLAQAYTLSSQNPDVAADYAYALVRAKQCADAEKIVAPAVADDPRNPDLQATLGDALACQGKQPARHGRLWQGHRPRSQERPGLVPPRPAPARGRRQASSPESAREGLCLAPRRQRDRRRAAARQVSERPMSNPGVASGVSQGRPETR